MNAKDLAAERRRDLKERNSIAADTGRSLLVEAAAGTGKTTLMIDRILHGLREGVFRMPGLVAITFTEKAAAELEARLRYKLAGAAGEANARSPLLLCEAACCVARAGDPAARANLRTALDEVDAAAVSTIHSFCASLLRQRPAEAGVDPDFEVLDATQADLLHEDCWQRWMAEQVRQPGGPLTEALRAGLSMADLRGLAAAAAATPELLDPEFRRPAADPARVPSLLAELKQRAGEARAFLQAHLKTGGNEHYRAVISAADRIGGASDDGPEGRAALRRAGYALAGSDALGALKSLATDARDDGRAVLTAFQAPAQALGAVLAGELAEWACGYVEFCRLEKRRRGVLDFQDLLLAAARMLRDRPETRAFFRTRYQAFFVDEFQDTDPLQAQVIAFLCERPDGPPAPRWDQVSLQDGKLFVVGDPKQSIYRFRRADVEVYERFKDLFRRLPAGDGAIRCISQNWRSTRPLILSLNDLFERVLKPPEDTRVFQAGHVPLVPSGDDPDAPSVVVVAPPEEVREVLGAAPAARRLEARCLARVLREVVEGRGPRALPGGPESEPLRWGDFALLLRALTDVRTYEDALEEALIPYRVVGGKSFYQRAEVGETLAVLRAVDDPLDHVSVVGALRSSYFGLSDEDLMRYHAGGGRWTYTRPGRADPNDPVAQAMALLGEWHAARAATPPHVLLRRIWGRTRAREAFLLKPAGLQRVANVEKLLQQLRALWDASAGSFRSVINYLALLHERREDEAESAVVEPGDDFVVLMSIHKAKGLEFPAVCLPDLGRGFPVESGAILCDRGGRRLEVGLGKGVRSERCAELLEREQENRSAEYRRLLYVAATRARRLLLLPLHWQGRATASHQGVLTETELYAAADSVPFAEVQAGAYYWDTRPYARDLMRRATAPPARLARPDHAAAGPMLDRRQQWLAVRRRVQARAEQVPPILQPSAAAQAGGAGGPAAGGPAEAELLQGPRRGLDGRAFGTLFHNLMRHVSLPDACKEPRRAPLEGLARIEARELGLPDEDAAEAAGLAARLLGMEEFRDLVASALSLQPEAPFAVPLSALPFFGPDRAGLLEGSIDLLVRRQGGPVVLDYKTDRLTAGQAGAAAEGYWPQLALYALAVQAAGRETGPVAMALCFVRPGVLLLRPLDDGAISQAHRRSLSLLPGRAGPDS